MRDEQRQNEESGSVLGSQSSVLVPNAGSIKDQLESLIAQTNFEAHKAEAVLSENQDQDKKFIDEYYNDVNERLKEEKDNFKD